MEEVLELLLRLIIKFNTKEVIDSYPASTLLVCLSRILSFLPDLNDRLPLGQVIYI